MKRVILLALLALTVNTAFAVNAPFPPWIKKISGDMTFSDSGASTIGANAVDETMLPNQSVDGLHPSRIAKATYDVTGGDSGVVGALGLGVTLPAKALIKKTWFYTETQFTDSGAGTVAISCEDANNLYTASDITGIAAGAFTDGAADGAGANMVSSIAAACEIKATVAGSDQTAGKLHFFVEYQLDD